MGSIALLGIEACEVPVGTQVTATVSVNNASVASGDYTKSTYGGRTYLNFKSTSKTNMTITVGTNPVTVSLIAVGGGGGGGWAEGGGGGAGGVIKYDSPTYSIPVGTYAIRIGAGGAGGVRTGVASATNASPGVNTTFGGTLLVAYGGSGGVSSFNTGGVQGGSGGGASVSNPTVPNTATAGQGFVGGNAGVFGTSPIVYAAGGGGGASSAGGNGTATLAGYGGDGVYWSNGEQSFPLALAGGGGGGGDGVGTGIAGFGGGNGASYASGLGNNGVAGTANTGGGGGGSLPGSYPTNNGVGGAGGSGFLSISFGSNVTITP